MSENLSPGLIEQIRAEMQAGRKIQAVKLYIDATDSSLREAKEYVEQLAEDKPVMGAKSAKSTQGCLGSLLWLIVIGGSSIVVAQRVSFF